MAESPRAALLTGTGKEKKAICRSRKKNVRFTSLTICLRGGEKNHAKKGGVHYREGRLFILLSRNEQDINL